MPWERYQVAYVYATMPRVWNLPWLRLGQCGPRKPSRVGRLHHTRIKIAENRHKFQKIAQNEVRFLLTTECPQHASVGHPILSLVDNIWLRDFFYGLTVMSRYIQTFQLSFNKTWLPIVFLMFYQLQSPVRLFSRVTMALSSWDLLVGVGGGRASALFRAVKVYYTL